MFGKTKAHAPQKRIDSLIGAGTVLHGDLTFTGGLRVDGEIHGNIAAADGDATTLVISEQAKVHGAIKVSHAVINGTINGPVVAS